VAFAGTFFELPHPPKSLIRFASFLGPIVLRLRGFTLICYPVVTPTQATRKGEGGDIARANPDWLA
jgi:hypothetical protein